MNLDPLLFVCDPLGRSPADVVRGPRSAGHEVIVLPSSDDASIVVRGCAQMQVRELNWYERAVRDLMSGSVSPDRVTVGDSQPVDGLGRAGVTG